MKIRILFILCASLLAHFSCSVKISKQEKVLLPYKNLGRVVFELEDNSRDSMKYDGTRKSNEPLDVFLYNKVFLKSGGSNKRYYSKMVTLQTFNENFTFDSSRIFPSMYFIFYSKFPGENSMSITIKGFDQTYELSNHKSDTLIFTDSGCSRINYCDNKIIYHKKLGIIQIESSRATWKLKELFPSNVSQ